MGLEKERKPNRLKDYDYSQNGYYFVTICTKKTEKIFSSKNINAKYGEKIFQWQKSFYDHII